MLTVIDAILKAQGFEHRVDQYRQIKRQPDALICEKSVAASRYCDAVQFELKRFNKTDEVNLHVFNQELDSLRRL